MAPTLNQSAVFDRYEKMLKTKTEISPSFSLNIDRLCRIEPLPAESLKKDESIKIHVDLRSP